MVLEYYNPSSGVHGLKNVAHVWLPYWS